VFLLNAPLSAALIALIAMKVPRGHARPGRGGRGRLDVGGAPRLTGGLTATTFGVQRSTDNGFLTVPALVPILGGLALLAGFVVHEGRTTAPIIPLAALRNRSLVCASIATGLMAASFLGLIYQATLFVQQVHGYSPLAAGASTVPIAVRPCSSPPR
jgi:hypothetical protein